MSDLEDHGMSAADDQGGGAEGVNARAVRIRELAIAAMVSIHAKQRLERGDKARPHRSILEQASTLQAGDLVEVY
jgi:hypothetical protein